MEYPCKLDRTITDDASLVSVMMVNNEIGTIQPIKKLCEITHEHGGIFHTDAVQGVGHIGIDVKNLNVDMLSCSAHKFYGPKGIGFLYIKKVLRCFLIWKEELKNLVCVQEQKILHRLYVTGVDFIRNGAEPYAPGNLSLSFKGVEGELLLHRLDLMGIMVSTGSACDSKNTQISHVLKAIEADEKYALGTIRISLGRDNTNDEAVKIAEALISILKKMD